MRSGWARRKRVREGRRGQHSAMPLTERGPSGGMWEGALPPLHFYQEPVLGSNKCMPLYSSIAPVCNYFLLWLSLFYIHKRHTLRRYSSSIYSDQLHDGYWSPGLTHIKAWAVTYKGPFCTRMPPPVPTVIPEIYKEFFFWVRRVFPKLQPFDYVCHCFCQICISPTYCLFNIFSLN